MVGGIGYRVSGRYYQWFAVTFPVQRVSEKELAAAAAADALSIHHGI